MGSHRNYFLLNKKSDYIKGSAENITFHNSMMQIQDIEKEAWFFSGVFDSQEKHTQWAKVVVEQENMDPEMLTLIIFTAESIHMHLHGHLLTIEEIIKNQEYTFHQKLQIFSNFEAVKKENVTDCLLSKVEGRYLWFALLFNPKKKVARIKGIQIYFPKESWVNFLPEVYQKQVGENDFLERYLGIFQSIYDDMTKKIEETPHLLYPRFADFEFLQWLATWLATENIMIWNQKQLIYLMENSIRLYGIRGTKEYMEEMVCLYTGCKPYIIEYYQTRAYKTELKKEELLERLYGEHAYIITIILPTGVVKTQQELVIIQRIVNHAVPAYLECKIVVLEPFIFLNRYSYIGLNSVLGTYREMRVDDNALLPYLSVIKKQQEVLT